MSQPRIENQPESYNSIVHKVKILNVQSSHFDELLNNKADKRVVLIDNNNVWLKENNSLPYMSELKKNGFNFLHDSHRDRQTCILIKDFIFFGHTANSAINLVQSSLRSSLDHFDSKTINDLMLGSQLIKWSEAHLFCNRCGEALQVHLADIAKHCSRCDHSHYPVISPVAIALIYRKVKNSTELLLAKSHRASRFYSCVAGFIEAGESIENCVHREILEEVGVLVKNLNYFGSQPWPFPSQLMIGFTAEWESGEINIDKNELVDANWFSVEALPPVPPKISIAGRMIAQFT